MLHSNILIENQILDLKSFKIFLIVSILMSKVNNILLDFSAKKIQRFFKNSNIIKNYNLFLKNFSDAQINLTECIKLKKKY